MNELVSDRLWPTIQRIARRSASKKAAVAYITTDEFVEFGEGDILIADASNPAIKCGQTSAQILALAVERGAEVYSISGLHAKVLVLDGTAIVGSANLSTSSDRDLIEAAWVTDNIIAVGLATDFISQLAKAAKRVDDAYIRRIVRIPVVKPVSTRLMRARNLRIKPETKTWIIGVQELARDFPEEEPDIARGQEIAAGRLAKKSSEISWLRWTGTSRFRSEAREGHQVIQIWSRARGKTPFAVYKHMPIRLRQHEPKNKCTRFYIEEFANADDVAISWTEFKRLLKREGLRRKITPGCARPIDEQLSERLGSSWGT